MLGAVMLIAVGWGLVKRHPLDLILLAAWIPSFVYIGSWTRQSQHYLLYFYPVLALGAARLIAALTAD
ncbi:hypothetical protein L9G15_23130, partial [Shewanella sp. A3A]|nr:hypothetical protein [Shewanella ferrihydritica]